MDRLLAVLQLGLAGLAAILGGLALGVYVTVAIAGWTGPQPIPVARQAPAWLDSARTIYHAAAAGAGLSAIGWVYVDWRHRPAEA